MKASWEDLDLLRDPAASGVHQIEQRHLEALRALLNAHDLLHGLLAPRAGLDRVVVGHHTDGAAPDHADTGHDAISGRVRLLVAREQEVLLEIGAGIEQQLQSVADEQLAFLSKLVAILEVALFDARPLVAIALLAHAWTPPMLAATRAAARPLPPTITVRGETEQPRG